MSIRNKRLLKEQPKLKLHYNITYPVDWKGDTIILKCTHHNVNLFINVYKLYPFQYPRLYIGNIDYIQWLLNKRHKYVDIINMFNINIPCICCDTITCNWSPSHGIKEILDEFNKYYMYFYLLVKFKIIYKKIDGFDDLIYTNIIHFLYLNNI